MAIQVHGKSLGTNSSAALFLLPLALSLLACLLPAISLFYTGENKHTHPDPYRKEEPGVPFSESAGPPAEKQQSTLFHLREMNALPE